MITPGFSFPSTPPDKQGRKIRDYYSPANCTSSVFSIINKKTFQDILREFAREERAIKQTAKEFAAVAFKDQAEESEQGRGTWSRA
jgi:hypothetical protein